MAQTSLWPEHITQGRLQPIFIFHMQTELHKSLGPSTQCFPSVQME